jgi:hypothetical protein
MARKGSSGGGGGGGGLRGGGGIRPCQWIRLLIKPILHGYKAYVQS